MNAEIHTPFVCELLNHNYWMLVYDEGQYTNVIELVVQAVYVSNVHQI